MFRTIAGRLVTRSQKRSLSLSSKRFEKLPEGVNPTPEPNTSSRLTNFDKKILIWTKKYKSIEDIPPVVNRETLNQARNRFRVKVCNYMIVLTLIGCATMVISGKRAAERGESVVKMNEDWHKKYNEDFAKSDDEN